MYHTELGELFIEQERLSIELSRVNAKIGQVGRKLSDEDVEHTKSVVTEDPVKFGKWIKQRRERLNPPSRNKKQIKRDILNGGDVPMGWTCVYGLYQEGVLVYVGISKDYHRRMRVHMRDPYKVFDYHTILELHRDRNGARKGECVLIERYSPMYNRTSMI